MLTTTKLASCLKVGTHGTTFGGNPLACAVASRAFDLISTPEMLSNVKQKELLFRALISEINAEFPIFDEVRGAGLLLGAALKEEYKGRAREFMLASAEQGLMILVAGPDVIRFAPALNISDDEIKEAMAKLKSAIEAVLKG